MKKNLFIRTENFFKLKVKFITTKFPIKNVFLYAKSGFLSELKKQM